MTNEEVKVVLKSLADNPLLSAEHITKALYKAIELVESQPCEDCVSRNAIIKTLNEMDRYIADELTLCDTNKKYPKNEVFIVDDVYELIAENLPPVTPQLKTGKWIKNDRQGVKAVGNLTYHCSECGREICSKYHGKISLLKEYPYCHCGAKMGGGEDENN